jgi:hypothetical protein
VNTFELFSNVGGYDASVVVEVPGDPLAKPKATGVIPPGSFEQLTWERVFIPKTGLKPPAPAKKLTAILIKARSTGGELETDGLESSRIWAR